MSAAWNGRDELRAMRQVMQIYGCGPRSCFELLRELAADPVARQDIDALLERYSRLNPRIIDALDGRRLRPPVFVVDDNTPTSLPRIRGAA